MKSCPCIPWDTSDKYPSCEFHRKRRCLGKWHFSIAGGRWIFYTPFVWLDIAQCIYTSIFSGTRLYVASKLQVSHFSLFCSQNRLDSYGSSDIKKVILLDIFWFRNINDINIDRDETREARSRCLHDILYMVIDRLLCIFNRIVFLHLIL